MVTKKEGVDTIGKIYLPRFG